MKPYTLHVDLELPRDRVIELFDDVDNLYKWQTGLQSFEHLSGEPGQPGARSKLLFKAGKRQIELIEVITERNLPESFNGHYEWSGGKNTLTNTFIELSPERTRWESTTDYHLKSPLMKLMGLFMGRQFRKQSLMFMTNFKTFAEEGKDIREESSPS